MNFFQHISAMMTTSQAIAFWLCIIIFIIASALAIIGFAIDRKIKVNEMQKKLNRLQKENNELMARTNTLKSLYYEQFKVNDEMRRKAR